MVVSPANSPSAASCSVTFVSKVLARSIDLIRLQAETPYDTPRADLGDQIDAMGQTDAAAVPFLARVDDQGRFTYFEMTTKRSSGGDTCLTTEVSVMSKLGDPVSVKAPAADSVQEATEAQYRSL